MFNSNDNSMLWLLILFMLVGNNSNSFVPPTDEEICKVFEKTIDTYLEENKELLEKAQINSPLWQIKELSDAAKEIEDLKVRLKVINVAFSVKTNLESTNAFCCGGMK